MPLALLSSLVALATADGPQGVAYQLFSDTSCTNQVASGQLTLNQCVAAPDGVVGIKVEGNTEGTQNICGDSYMLARGWQSYFDCPDPFTDSDISIGPIMMQPGGCIIQNIRSLKLTCG